MSVFISTPTETDYEPSYEMIAEAFKDVPHSTHREHEWVKRLRMSPNYHFELEVIAKTEDGTLIGHAMCTEVKIQNEYNTYTALALAPLAVVKAYRNKGLGKALVQALEERALSEEYTTILVLGDGAYYEKLGYEVAGNYDIYLPPQMGETELHVKFLWDALADLPNGTVIYPSEFLK